MDIRDHARHREGDHDDSDPPPRTCFSQAFRSRSSGDTLSALQLEQCRHEISHRHDNFSWRCLPCQPLQI